MYPPRYVALLAYIAWEIWLRRNAKIFEEKQFDFHEVLRKATDRWQEDDRIMEEQTKRKERSTIAQNWEKPDQGSLKLNTDIAVWKDGRVGFGFALRDNLGKVILAGKTESRAAGSSTILEGMAMRYALQTVERYRFRASHIECDNESLVSRINGENVADMYSIHIVQDIKKIMTSMESVECRYIPRQANEVAHYIAHGPEFISINHNPAHVLSFIEKDVIAC